VAVIGKKVREQLFAADENPVGEDITINGITFQVIGVFASMQNGNQQQEEQRIYIPNSTLRHSFNQLGNVGSFVIVPKPGLQSSQAESDVKNYLAQINKVSPDDKGVFGSFNLQEEHNKVEGLFTGIKFFSWMVAVGTIFAGAVGVGNIMLIVVKERTREIGLRKALGATPASIVSMIVQESVFITAVAGYSGLVVGSLLIGGMAKMLEASGGRAGFFGAPEVEFKTAIVALSVLLVSGLLLLASLDAASVASAEVLSAVALGSTAVDSPLVVVVVATDVLSPWSASPQPSASRNTSARHFTATIVRECTMARP